MKDYYRFNFSNGDIMEIEVDKSTLDGALATANKAAANLECTYTYFGVVRHEKF